VVLPQDRPHDEQAHLAAAAARIAPVTVRTAWPDEDAWASLLQETVDLDPQAWAGWSDGGAADRFAALVDDVAGVRAA
jgi:hypothetical protein